MISFSDLRSSFARSFTNSLLISFARFHLKYWPLLVCSTHVVHISNRLCSSFSLFTVDDLQAIEPIMQDGSIFLAQLEIPFPTVEYALRLAKLGGMTTILNPAPSAPISTECYSLIDILTPNEREASDLTGVEVISLDDAKKAASLLRSRGCSNVIITLGAKGSLLSHGEVFKYFPSYPVDSIDTVAAGDAFNGALAAVLSENKSLEEAVLFANAAGALCTTKRGAQESLPTRRDIDQFMGST